MQHGYKIRQKLAFLFAKQVWPQTLARLQLAVQSTALESSMSNENRDAH